MMVFTLILSLSPLVSLEMWPTRDENDCDNAKEDAAEGVVEGAEKKDRSAREETRGPSPASTVSARDYGPSETILMGGGGCTGSGVSISKANEVSESSESWPVRRHGVTMARLLLAVIALPGIDAVGIDSATLTTSPYRRVLNSYTPLTDSNVKTAAQLWVSNQASAASTYGLVDSWDLSQVTSLANVWCGYDAANCGSAYSAMRSFNGNISGWDVSKVTSINQSKSIRIFPNEVT
jgi:hypothetical protein